MCGGEPTLLTQLSRYLRYVHLDKMQEDRKLPQGASQNVQLGHTHHNSYYVSEHVSLLYLSSSLRKLVDPENGLLTLMVFVRASGWKVLTTQIVRNIQTPLVTASGCCPIVILHLCPPICPRKSWNMQANQRKT